MNQYRCETCKNRGCPLPKYYSDNSEKFETGIMYSLSKMVGCASHSDFKSQRDKVLDEGIAKIQERIDRIFEGYRGETNENITHTPYNMANGMGEAQKILKELRQAGEP
jgi:hypothetical protein